MNLVIVLLEELLEDGLLMRKTLMKGIHCSLGLLYHLDLACHVSGVLSEGSLSLQHAGTKTSVICFEFGIRIWSS